MRYPGKTPDEYFDTPMASHALPSRAFMAFAKPIVLAFMKLYWRWSSDGTRPFTPITDGSVGSVLVANHASMLDPTILMAMTFGKNKRPIRPLFKSEFGESGFLTWFFSRTGGIPLRRGSADTKAIRRAVNILKNGENLLVFPEGTRIWDPEARPELFGGFSLIALMAGADVVPIAIDGSEFINPYKKHVFSRPSRVRIRFGEPIKPSDVPGETRREQSEALEKMAMDEVYRMRKELRIEAGKDKPTPELEP